MLVPPKGDDLLAGLKRKAPESRGFQQNVPHSRVWAGLDEPDEDDVKSAQRNAEMEAKLAEHRAARGPSLFDQHQKDLARQGKKPKGGRAEAPVAGGGAFSWDREEAMGTNRRMTAADVTG